MAKPSSQSSSHSGLIQSGLWFTLVAICRALAKSCVMTCCKKKEVCVDQKLVADLHTHFLGIHNTSEIGKSRKSLSCERSNF